ncbi:hypothetical protein L873DRAFT_1887983 [Choiromyces venosus 120613-1]|uniref:Uncharacterized protein n=1 Tax=Choiromyces venosus 120613-1 TaxID=1336337 RepID=A0A3N4JZF8_9PEZI|nr:hypothetical protein L873DRAFT_1887983 [Choiromyces venosus 120613-1]
MPARRLAFTEKNILSAWEAVGIFLFNVCHALEQVKQKEQNISNSETSSIHILKTPCTKLKALLSGLSEGFQQMIANKTMEEEAYRQYWQLVGQEKKAKTSNCCKLTQTTIVTSETVIQLREQQERVDAIKAA